MKNLEYKTCTTSNDVCKWVNQYKKLIDLFTITYDSIKQEFVVFYYWKSKDN